MVRRCSVSVVRAHRFVFSENRTRWPVCSSENSVPPPSLEWMWPEMSVLGTGASIHALQSRVKPEQ